MKKISIFAMALLFVVFFFSCNKNDTMEKTKSYEPRDARLEYTFWKLEKLNSKPVVSYPNQREAHIIFNPGDMTVSGSGGCNNFSGSYSIEGNKIKFSKVRSTLMACPEGMEQEAEFVNALGGVTNFKAAGDVLQLFNGEAAVATFVMVPYSR